MKFRGGKWVFLSGGLVFTYAVLGFLVVPWAVTTWGVPNLSEQVGRPVKVTNVALNPFALTLEVQGFEVQEVDQTPLVGFETLFVNFQLSSLFRGTYTFDEIRLSMPFGLVKIGSDGNLNLAALGWSSPAPDVPVPSLPPDQGSEANGGLPPVEIAKLSIERGIVEFHDDSRPTPFSTDIVPIDIMLKDFSTWGSQENPYTVTAELDTGGTLSWEGTFSLEPVSTEGQVTLTGLHVRTFWEYLQDQLRFEIRDGVLDLKTKYHVEIGEGPPALRLMDGGVNLRRFSLLKKGSQDALITIPSLTIDGVALDLLDQRVTLESVRTQDARIVAWRNEEGDINYLDLLPQDSTVPEEQFQEKTFPAAASEKVWTALVKKVSVENYSVAFEDRTPEGAVPLHLESLQIQLAHLTVPPSQPVGVSMGLQVNQTGTIHVDGHIGLNPISADLNLEVSEIGLNAFQPYLTAQNAKLALFSGKAGLKGEFHYHSQSKDQPAMAYTGSLDLHRLAFVDRELNQELITWDSLMFGGVSLSLDPTSITIAQILHKKPVQHVSIRPDGTVNLLSLMEGFKKVATEGQSSKGPNVGSDDSANQPVPIRIDSIQVQDGTLTFVDRSLKPPVSTGIHQIHARMHGVSSKPGEKARVRIEGQVDRHAPLLIRGETQPLSHERDGHVTVTLKGLDVTAKSPYSQKFSGYPIKKGNLSLDLLYKISGSRLQAHNHVQLDQLAFGDHMDNPDAMSLPLPLAVALLKDRKGMIDIELPMEGDLNNPEFSFGGVVLTALVNLINKAATSPFALIGGLVGGDEEDLQVVQFLPGTRDWSPDQEAKLQSLAQALNVRPGLVLEVTGTAGSGSDRMVLIEGKLQQNLRKAKLREQKIPHPSVPRKEEAMVFTPEEENRLLKILYVQTFGTQPVQGVGPSAIFTGSSLSPNSEIAGVDPSVEAEEKPGDRPLKPQELPPEVIKERLSKSIDVSDFELRQLAKDRGKQIRDYLLNQGRIPAERIVLVSSELNPPSDQEFVPSHLALTAK
jgi:uncharacterized protein involved in outer membrane biogenesis